MKKFTKQINERLKLNKDTKISIKKINDISINNIQCKTYVCCLVLLKSKDKSKIYKIIPNQEKKLMHKLEIFRYDHKKGDIYKIMFTWVRQHNPFKCYTNISINSPFFWFIHEDDTPMYILFNDENEAKVFIDNYDNIYKNEVMEIYEKYLNNNEEI